MNTMQIKLDTIDKVKRFVNIVAAMDGEVDLKSGRYVVDAKSIMGILSLDLDKPVTLVTPDAELFRQLSSKLAEFTVSSAE
jgi:phosphotransferase system HPr-like phosphotransfer protein